MRKVNQETVFRVQEEKMKHSIQFLDRSKRIVPISLLALLALVMAACQPAAVTSTQSVPVTVATSTEASVPVTGATATTASGAAATLVPSGSAAEAVVNVATDPKLGKILVDGKGMTLYMFKKDAPDQSNCSGNCLKSWPPLLSQAAPKAGDGVDASLLGTASMPDGTMIVTYNKMPLYYFAKDTKAGDVNGQEVGNVWYVVSPDGKPVEGSGTADATSQPAQASAGVTVKVSNDPKLGNILVDGEGKTLYIFTKDTPDVSNCSAGCQKAWPPLVVQDNATAGDGVNTSLLGTATLSDGRKIVTYNHMPLYYWAADMKAGDTNGQGVQGVWFVISPDGKPVGMNSDTSTSPKY
jgi:predicted lipoprotein with Yx(FWY)xxD motif